MKSWKEKNKLFLYAILILASIIYGFYTYRNMIKDTEEKAWVIAKFYDKYDIPRRNTILKFEYHYLGKNYKSKISVRTADVPLGILNYQYLIRISVKNPQIHMINEYIQVPDSIQNQPPQGWERIPGWAGEKR